MVLTEEERLGFELKLPALPDDGHYTTNDIVKLSQAHFEAELGQDTGYLVVSSSLFWRHATRVTGFGSDPLPSSVHLHPIIPIIPRHS